MSRVLAQLMGAAEPTFRAQLMKLEQAAGLPGADIRLMMEIITNTRVKIRELNLDPQDTTGRELYEALKNKLRQDETLVRAGLNIRADNSVQTILEGVLRQLQKTQAHGRSFVIKQSVMRAMLKKLQPKVTMKKLGYRSMDSMLKHEPVPQLLAAASLLESSEWQQKRLDLYGKLKSSDFESRSVSFYLPQTKQWPAIAAQYVDETKHNILTLPELGSTIILPLKHDLPGLAITTLLLSIEGVNSMRALGSYVKLQQVRVDFGTVFQRVIQKEPDLGMDVLGQQLPWQMVQWFYGKGHVAYHPEVFEPHLQPEDLSWHDAEGMLSDMHPILQFWQGSQLLALVDDSRPVSFNMLDVALSVCNGLEYSQRVVAHMRESLSRELMARYLHHDNLHDALLGRLDQQLSPAFVGEITA